MGEMRRIELRWGEKLKLVIPVSLLAFVFILNIQLEKKVDPSSAYGFLVVCVFMMAVAGLIECLIKPIATFVEKRFLQYE